jgi:hypothetical protein
MRGVFRFTLSLFAAATLVGAVPAFAQNQYPLEILNIKPVGTPPSGMPAASRIYHAYPGLTYNIKAAVIGGLYPYSFTLANAPAGMTVNASTGEINWPSPSANASPTLTIRDSAGNQISTTWPITVGTAGFRFIDATNGNDSGAGTAASPWRTVARAKTASSVGDIWYFRRGTYRVQSEFGPLSNPGTSRYAADFRSGESVVMWLGYPGETPVIDYEYFGNASAGQYFPTIAMSGGLVYVDGFELRNTQHFFFLNYGNGQGPLYRRLSMHNQGKGWIENGSNTSFLMYEHAQPQSYGAVIQDNTFYDGGLGIKQYDLLNPLIADNVFYDLSSGIEEKAGTTRFTIRGNNFYRIGYLSGIEWAIGGNMNTQNGFVVSGEVCFNLARMNDLNDEAYNFNWMGNAGRIDAYRNTFVGKVTAIAVDSSDGPFSLSSNVIINNDNVSNHVGFDQVTDPSRITMTNNLSGFPSNNIVDANGNLTAAYAQYVGNRGYQLGAGGGSGTQVPGAPQNLRITPP